MWGSFHNVYNSKTLYSTLGTAILCQSYLNFLKKINKRINIINLDIRLEPLYFLYLTYSETFYNPLWNVDFTPSLFWNIVIEAHLALSSLRAYKKHFLGLSFPKNKDIFQDSSQVLQQLWTSSWIFLLDIVIDLILSPQLLIGSLS